MFKVFHFLRWKCSCVQTGSIGISSRPDQRDKQGQNYRRTSCPSPHSRGIPNILFAPCSTISSLFQILELVHQLHLMDLIHADLKPDNFLVTDLPGMGLKYPFLKYIPSYIKLLFRPSQSVFANDRLRESFRHAAGNLTHYQDEYCTVFSDSRAHCLHRPSLDLWTSVRRDARASSLASSH